MNKDHERLYSVIHPCIFSLPLYFQFTISFLGNNKGLSFASEDCIIVNLIFKKECFVARHIKITQKLSLFLASFVFIC